MRTLLAAVLGLTVVTAIGCKGDMKKCELASRNYANLVYWDQANKEIAALPEAAQKTERQKRQVAFDNEVEGNITSIASQCVSANNDKMVDCMIKAKTAAEARKCASPIKGKP